LGGGRKEDQKPNWLKEKEKWRKKREGSKEKEKPKAAATTAITEDAAWMAHFSDSNLDDDDNIMSSTNVTLDDLLEVDKELRNELSRGKGPRKEYYSIQNAGNTACTYTLHETNGSEESRGLWNELVEGESVEIDERVDNEANQPIPQPAEFEPESEDVDWPITPQIDKDPTDTKIGESEIVAEDPGERAVDREKEPTTPKGTKLPLVQPEEQGCGGKTASGEAGEGVIEVDWGIVTVDKRPKETSMKELEPAQEYYPGATWNFQEIAGKPPRQRKVCLEAMERRKVSSKVEDDVKSVLDWEVATLAGNKNGCQRSGGLVEGLKEGVNEGDKMTYLDIKIERDLEIGPTPTSKQPYTNPIPARFSFEGAEPAPMPMDPNVTLSKGQYPSSLAEIVKTKNLPCREGIGPLTHTPKPDGTFPIAIDTITAEFCEEPPQISSDQSRGGGGTSWVNPRKHAGGARLSDATKRDFRDLKGRGDISLISGAEENHLPVFGDAGGAPQHKKVGYMPMVDKGLVSWTPKKQVANTTTMKEAEKDEAATVGMQMWLRGPGDPFWESFPPLIDINKQPPKVYKQTYQQHSQMFTHMLGLRSD